MNVVVDGVSRGHLRAIEKALGSLPERAPASVGSVVFEGGSPGGFPVLQLVFTGWALGFYHRGEAHEWLCEQRCPICGAGSRWIGTASIDGPRLFCGGCGVALGPRHVGIQTELFLDDTSVERFSLRAETQALLQWAGGGMNPLAAAMEAAALDVFIEDLLLAVEPLTW